MPSAIDLFRHPLSLGLPDLALFYQGKLEGHKSLEKTQEQ
jgi:hypothetical protein